MKETDCHHRVGSFRYNTTQVQPVAMQPGNIIVVRVSIGPATWEGGVKVLPGKVEYSPEIIAGLETLRNNPPLRARLIQSINRCARETMKSWQRR